MNKIEFFKANARRLFSILETEFKYTFEDENIFRYADTDWSMKLLYSNEAKNLRITIEQAPYYTDYGFTFSIQKTSTNEEVIICNIAHEKQDAESNFLVNARELIFLNTDAVDLISGKKWKNYDKILLQQ